MNAENALYKYAENVGRDVAEFEKAKRNGDWITAGVRFGDILRIVVWNEPNELDD